MTVRYSRPLGWILVGLGVACLILTLVLLGLGSIPVVAIVGGLLCALLGYAYLTRPYFRAVADAIEVLALIGPAIRRYPFAKRADLFLVDGSVWVRKDGRRRKVPVNRFLADRGDWQAFQSQYRSIEESPPAKPR